MYNLAKAAVNLSARGVRYTAVRQCHHKTGPNFHEKYGNLLLATGFLFCASVWGYVATQTGLVWNISPVGRITPKPWNEE
ncbi:cytochrome c oxidase subunit 7B, mitochondrial [Erpetoichthys calabaricus]|uniref:Cytochrome c oxidase subunit 7B, mitochondrial n=1 Tax=Erpetoichthys calabaricus TaxID=27687 RepID=A0A8C4SCT3_ERPCA|nr:cytochrome c oxidase subunit 7B, mitochondrial [Erpetoichthys calabaricus]